jgi:hypothetical protein
MNPENELKFTNILYGLSPTDAETVSYLEANFCGTVIKDSTLLTQADSSTTAYIYGDIEQVMRTVGTTSATVYAITELSHNIGETVRINLGELPINIHGVGVMFNELFFDTDYFDALISAHEFQHLTESNKEGVSYRKGLYITKVTESKDDSRSFHLLRCSTNLEGPTDNIRDVDEFIINKVNNLAQRFYKQKVTLNHVLAQVYNNSVVDGKQKKATIKQHSDKTKDMDKSGLMAFCTFYKFDDKIKYRKGKSLAALCGKYDYYYKKTSVLTKLRFRLKPCVKDDNLVKSFDVTLYPNSVFITSLKTNRLYTHEIIPSSLPVQYLPTRLGYVIRCSKTEAVHKDGTTYIVTDKGLTELAVPTFDKIKDLKDMYYKENATDELVDYGDRFDFSLNNGDYSAPNL